MTPEQKANELVRQFSWIDCSSDAKQCALICVDEILTGSRLFYIEDYDYWKEVKQEINKL